MRINLGLVAVGLLAAAAGGLGCGGNGTASQQDAGLDAPAKFDAGRDVASPQEDAGPACGTFAALQGCGWELTRCTVVKDKSDECGGDLDCVDAGLYGLVCLRKCTCSAECGFNTVCMPSKSTDYVDATETTQIIGSARGHCFYSFCGGEGDATSPFGNGNFFGACDLGKDAFIKPGKVDTRAGTCFPLSTDVPDGYLAIGLCQQAGASPRGGSCSFDTNQCADSSTFDACAVGTTCIGRRGDQVGTCAKLCDPHAAGFNPAVTGDCAADSAVTHDQFCQDSSSYQRDCTATDGGVTYSNDIFYTYVGFCVDVQGCDALSAANTCANVTTDGGVESHACHPTAPVDSFGLCSPSSNTAPGGVCNTTSYCAPGYACITVRGQVNGTCEKYCGLGDNAAKLPCGANEFCDKILYGTDPSAACGDDPWTLGFGICRPDTRQDGGVQEDAGQQDAAQQDAAQQDAGQQDGANDV